MSSTAWDTFLEEHDLRDRLYRSVPPDVRISLEQFVESVVLLSEEAYGDGIQHSQLGEKVKTTGQHAQVRHCRNEKLWGFLRKRVRNWVDRMTEHIHSELNQGETYRSYNGNRRGPYLPKGPRRR